MGCASAALGKFVVESRIFLHIFAHHCNVATHSILQPWRESAVLAQFRAEGKPFLQQFSLIMD